MSVHIKLMYPNGLVWDNEVEEIILPSLTGELGVLEDHAPLITALESGLLRIKLDNIWKPIIVYGGFAVILNNKVTVLVNNIEYIVPEKAEEAQALFVEATKELEIAETMQEKMEKSQMLKLASGRLRGYKYLNETV